MLEKILLYNVKRPQDIIKAASNMRIISGFINESDTDRTLAEIAADSLMNPLIILILDAALIIS